MTSKKEVKRNYRIWETLDICAMEKAECIKELIALTELNRPSSVFLLGIPMAVKSMKNSYFRDMYNNSTMTIIDGMPIVKFCRKDGIRCDRCSGPDIMPYVFEQSVMLKKSHYFYGGNNQEIVNLLCEKLENLYPGIEIKGKYSPPFRKLTDEEDSQICKEINDLKPDFIWVGIGAPKQEIWIMEHMNKIDSGVMLGVGAAFNFYTGKVKKAPKWIENIGLEWLYRLYKEPNRLWRRYVISGFRYIQYSLTKRNMKLAEETRDEDKAYNAKK